MKSRARSWLREEVILALDLYLADGLHDLRGREDLSRFLRALPIEPELAADVTFRNEQAVRNMLYNLQWLDTDGQQGREKGGETTSRVWGDFGRDRARVSAAAAEIRLAAEDSRQLPPADEEDEYEADETGVVIRTHRQRERDPGLRRRKREKVHRETGKLACEACGFDSEGEYGIGGVIDCHHVKAVSELRPGEPTRLSDLRLVCPNRHRLIHAVRRWLTWDQIRAMTGAQK